MRGFLKVTDCWLSLRLRFFWCHNTAQGENESSTDFRTKHIYRKILMLWYSQNMVVEEKQNSLRTLQCILRSFSIENVKAQFKLWSEWLLFFNLERRNKKKPFRNYLWTRNRSDLTDVRTFDIRGVKGIHQQLQGGAELWRRKCAVRFSTDLLTITDDYHLTLANHQITMLHSQSARAKLASMRL